MRGTSMNKEIAAARTNGIFSIIVATITGLFLIISTLITSHSANDLKNDYKELQISQVGLESRINALQEEVSNLKEQSKADQTAINTLREQNSILEEELKSLSAPEVSIFDLNTVNPNEEYWFNHSDDYSPECFVDKDGAEYLTAHISFHHGTDKEEVFNPTYPLNNEYSICSGKMVWSSVNEFSDKEAWLEFYSEDRLLFHTEKITADSGPVTFAFSVKGIKELKIVKNGTEPSYGRLVIIYPYLNLK